MQLFLVSCACTGCHAVAAKQGAVAHLAALARDLNAKGAAAVPALVAALCALAAALGSDDARAKLTDADAVLLCKVLAQHAGAVLALSMLRLSFCVQVSGQVRRCAVHMLSNQNRMSTSPWLIYWVFYLSP